jgi:hypothetical protein
MILITTNPKTRRKTKEMKLTQNQIKQLIEDVKPEGFRIVKKEHVGECVELIKKYDYMYRVVSWFLLEIINKWDHYPLFLLRCIEALNRKSYKLIIKCSVWSPDYIRWWWKTTGRRSKPSYKTPDEAKEAALIYYLENKT